MKTCKTCKWWKVEGDHEERWCDPHDYPSGARLLEGQHEVRVCHHDKQTFCETPMEKNGFGVADGSTYIALLITAEDFGCVRHEH